MEHYTFFVVGGQPLVNTARSEVCVQNISDNSIHFIKINNEICEILKQHFPNLQLPEASPEPYTSAASKPTEEVATAVIADEPLTSELLTDKHWSRAATLRLIALRKQFESQFKSTTVRNEQVWKLISKDMHAHNFAFTHTQCRDKWQYLKKRYMKKKDNAGPRGTGEDRIVCEFFEELEDILGKKHNVDPPALASSSKGLSVTVPTSSEDDSTNALEDDNEHEVPPKKIKKQVTKKKDAVYKFMEDIRDFNERKEASRERRHQELIASRNRATEVFAEKMDLLIKSTHK